VEASISFAPALAPASFDAIRRTEFLGCMSRAEPPGILPSHPSLYRPEAAG
jgi:hypothetical protein